jgi:hypothetical protein
MSSIRRPSLGAVVGWVLVGAGFLLGSRALGDNSFLTHLATGRLILDSGSVPSTDPYTFTAGGEPWVVQSWLMSVLYATAEELGGAGGVRALVGIVCAALVGTLWMLTGRAESLLVRVAIVGLAIAVGAQMWSERPLLLGLLFFALTFLSVERGWSPWLLVPVGWVWANSHGSFPLGLVLLALLAIGRRLDGGTWGREPTHLGALGLGVVAGTIGPLGPQVLLFPVELLTGNEILESVTEWRAPTFEGTSQRLFLVQVVVAVGLLARRPSWRAGLPMAVFVASAMISARNIAVASIVLLPAMAVAAPVVGTLRGSARPAMARTAAILLLVAGPIVIAGRLGQQDYRLTSRYPAEALAWAQANGVGPLDGRLATQDFAGNLVDLLWGPHSQTFFDDRFDMFPVEVGRDYLRLTGGRPGWRAVLDRHDVESVVWRRDHPLSELLASDGSWSIAYSDDRWVLATRRG